MTQAMNGTADATYAYLCVMHPLLHETEFLCPCLNDSDMCVVLVNRVYWADSDEREHIGQTCIVVRVTSFDSRQMILGNKYPSQQSNHPEVVRHNHIL